MAYIYDMDTAIRPVRNGRKATIMSKLQTVYLKQLPTDCYGQPGGFDILEIGTGYTVRANINTYANALEIALRIDAKRVECGNEYMGADQ